MKRNLVISICLFVLITNLNAISSPQERVLMLIEEYYKTLEQLSNAPNPAIEQQIIDLFDDGGFVYNDLYAFESENSNGLIKVNQEARIDEYMGTISKRSRL